MTEQDVEGPPTPAPEDPPSLLESLTPVAPEWADGEAAQDRMAGWGTATGTLGDLVRWAGSVGQADAPFRRVRLVAFAADHGVSSDAGDAPSAGTLAARALLAGEGALPLLAQRADVSIRLVDVGLAGDPLPGDASARRVRAGSPPLARTDPLTPEEVEAALDLGARIADEEVDGGADLVVPVVLSESALVPATVLIGALCEIEPVRALGYDAYVPDAVWIARCAAVRDGIHRVHRAAATLATRRLLAIGGGADLAAAAGFLVRSAARRTPALLDGVGVAAAALVARALAPESPGWWCAPHASGSAGEKQAFSALRLRPAVQLGVRLGDGAGALLALPLLTAAVELARTAPRRAAPVVEETEVTVDPGDEIGGVGGYDAGSRAPEPTADVSPATDGAGVPITHPDDVDPTVAEPVAPAGTLDAPAAPVGGEPPAGGTPPGVGGLSGGDGPSTGDVAGRPSGPAPDGGSASAPPGDGAAPRSG